MSRSLLATTLAVFTIAASAGAATLPAHRTGSSGQPTATAQTHDSTTTKPKKAKKKTAHKEPTTAPSTAPDTPAKPPQ